MRAIRLVLSGVALLGALTPAAVGAQDWRDRDGRYYAREAPPPPPPPPGYYGRQGYGPPPGYRGPDRRPRCNRGTTGGIIGAIAGGLLGNSVAGRGDRGFGTIFGAGAGALAGRAIDRNC